MSTVQLQLKTRTINDSNHNVAVENASGVNLSTVTSGGFITTLLTATPTVSTQKTLATVIFTAKTGYYYSREPIFNIKSTNPTAFVISSTITKDDSNRILTKTFVIKYTNSIPAYGQLISFSHKTEKYLITPEQISAFIQSTPLNQITGFDLDLSTVASTGASRIIKINGSAGCFFNLKITKDNPSGSDTTYDFTTNSFTSGATQLTEAYIGISGVYSTNITLPAVTVDDTYTVSLVPLFALGTTLDSQLVPTPATTLNNNFLITRYLYQYKAVTITLSLVSEDSAGSYNTLPSNVTITGERYSSLSSTTLVTWPVSLSANAFHIARQGLEFDFRSTTTQTVNGAVSDSSRAVVLDSVEGLFEGMVMSGTGLEASTRLLVLNLETKTVTLSKDPSDGGIGDGVTISFTYGGTDTSEVISGHSFRVGYIAEDGTNPKFKTSLSPVVTLVNGAVSDSRVVNVDSQAGLLARSTVFVSGRGIQGAAVAPHVDTITHQSTANRLQLSANQTLDDNTELTFTGSSRSAEIVFDYYVDNFGSKDLTLTLQLDRIIPVS